MKRIKSTKNRLPQRNSARIWPVSYPFVNHHVFSQWRGRKERIHFICASPDAALTRQELRIRRLKTAEKTDNYFTFLLYLVGFVQSNKIKLMRSFRRHRWVVRTFNSLSLRKVKANQYKHAKERERLQT